MNGRIHLKNMLFYGYHGDLAEENKLGQRFIVDLVLTLDIAEVVRTDALEATVDYVRVHEVCRELVEGKKVRLIETLAARIADTLCGLMDGIADETALPLGLMMQHVEAIRAIVRENAKGANHPLALALAEQLDEAATQKLVALAGAPSIVP